MGRCVIVLENVMKDSLRVPHVGLRVIYLHSS